MKNMKLTLPLAGFTITLLFIVITNSAHISAFGPTPGPSSASRSESQPQISPLPQNNNQVQPQPQISPLPQNNNQVQPQPQPQSPIPPLFPTPSQPSTTMSISPSPQSPKQVGAIKASGTINSLVNTPTTKWIATGNWSMIAKEGGNSSTFATNMTWSNSNGTGTHTHELQNLVLTQQPQIKEQPAINLALKGLMDVGTNHRVVWHKVDSTIYIKNGKTISISLNDNETNHHFAGQTIYGVVHSVIRCSDIPLPNMEVLPPCS